MSRLRTRGSLKCYLSEAITILQKHEKKNLVKKFTEIYNYIEEYLAKEYEVEVFNPIKHESKISADEIYLRDISEIKKAHFVVAEVSLISWGVGAELMYAIMKGKPILALYNEDSPYSLSEMIRGSGVRLRKYSDKNWKTDIAKHLAEFMTELRLFLKYERRLLPRRI
jgi:nucleoside 2-deoxyribosyltransferase